MGIFIEVSRKVNGTASVLEFTLVLRSEKLKDSARKKLGEIERKGFIIIDTYFDLKRERPDLFKPKNYSDEPYLKTVFIKNSRSSSRRWPPASRLFGLSKTMSIVFKSGSEMNVSETLTDMFHSTNENSSMYERRSLSAWLNMNRLPNPQERVRELLKNLRTEENKKKVA